MTAATRTIALIGATSGLGRAAAGQLARDGHRLVLVGRDPQRVQRLAGELPDAVVIGADVSTAAGVDRAAERIGNAVDHLDALVNNAGVMVPTRQTTTEGIELNLAVHHLAPYSMTGRLLPLLRAGAGRVVNVNSEGHRAPLFGGGPVGLDLDDLNMEHDYEPFLAYSRTKLANLLFTYEFQRRHPDLCAVAVHPGMVRTDLGRHWPRLQVAAMHAISIPPRRGAKPITSLATAQTAERGAYYNRFTPTRSSPESHTPDLATHLWKATEALRGPFGD